MAYGFIDHNEIKEKQCQKMKAFETVTLLKYQCRY